MISPETLRRYPYFADINDESLRQVAMIAEEQTVPAGTTLFREDDKADSLYVVTDGELDVQYTLGNGELRTVDTVVAGELSMWSALVPPYKSTASGTARTDVTLIVLDAVKLRELCEVNHNLGFRILICLTKLLASRLEGARVQLATVD
jgi:CRP-like cAMP-binding protein